MQENLEMKRQPVECWARVCGYLRPVDNWNEGKQSEKNDRVVFEVKDVSTKK